MAEPVVIRTVDDAAKRRGHEHVHRHVKDLVAQQVLAVRVVRQRLAAVHVAQERRDVDASRALVQDAARGVRHSANDAAALAQQARRPRAHVTKALCAGVQVKPCPPLAAAALRAAQLAHAS